MSIQDKLKELIEGVHDVNFGVTSYATTPVETETEVETTIEESEEDVRLTARSFRTLYLAALAESMINEEVEQTSELETYGLMLGGKMTPKGKEYLKKYLPTIYAS